MPERRNYDLKELERLKSSSAVFTCQKLVKTFS